MLQQFAGRQGFIVTLYGCADSTCLCSVLWRVSSQGIGGMIEEKDALKILDWDLRSSSPGIRV